MVSLFTMNGSLARACALASLLGGTVSALPSDALLDSLQLAALEHEKDGRIEERDKTEVLLEVLARQRLVADSATEIPQRRLAELDRARAERSALEAEAESSRRKPPAEVARLLEGTPPQTADTIRNTGSVPPGIQSIPGVAPAAGIQLPASTPAPAAANASGPTSTCPGGPLGFRWIEPSASIPAPKGEGILDVKIRLDAPCGLSRIELYVDDLPPRSFPPPRTRAGVFEFSDHLPAKVGIHRLEVLACDTNTNCSRSLPLEAHLTGSVPSWVPKVVGGLVGICGLLGLSLLLRRRPHHTIYSQTPVEGRPSAVPVPEAIGLSGTLRKRLQQVAQEIGPAFPAVSLRLPDQPPPLSVDPEALGDAFSTMLRLHARRAESGGQILIAMGQGPLSAEVVFEDTATSPEEGSVQAILDMARPRVRERLGLDHELGVALESFHRAGGSLVAEVRIDGGLRTRMKVPLAPMAHPA
jgi:hypothetical protein